MIRINKYLARCGVTSRRHADVLVADGRVEVNGQVIDTPGFRVDELKDEVKVDGKPVSPIEKYTYVVLNKPAGVITSSSDPHHDRTVLDLVADVPAQIYPVGRLDLDTEGVLLFTDHGELAHRLTHPRFEIRKIYSARVQGVVPESKLKMFSRGIKLPDGKIGRAEASIAESGTDDTILRLELAEGRKREVKHLCGAVGHPVIRLIRIEFAGIETGDLKPGQWRYLSEEETARLRQMVEL